MSSGVAVADGFFVMCYGTEFTSNHFDAGAYFRGIDVDFIRPGKPVDNVHIESFNGRLRGECLNANWFDTLDDARSLIESWRTGR